MKVRIYNEKSHSSAAQGKKNAIDDLWRTRGTEVCAIQADDPERDGATGIISRPPQEGVTAQPRPQTSLIKVENLHSHKN